MDTLNSEQIKKILPLMKQLNVKDIQQITGCEKTKASELNRDIKQHYNLDTKICLSHLIDYLKIPLNPQILSI